MKNYKKREGLDSRREFLATLENKKEDKSNDMGGFLRLSLKQNFAKGVGAKSL